MLLWTFLTFFSVPLPPAFLRSPIRLLVGAGLTGVWVDGLMGWRVSVWEGWLVGSFITPARQS